MVIGGYWIGLTMFVVPAFRSTRPGRWLASSRWSRPWGSGSSCRSERIGTPVNSWTHYAAVGLLWTWPFAWIFLIMVSRSL